MTRYQVDSEAVFGATGAVRATIGRIQSEVEAMHGQLTTLQGSWQGDAATAFQTLVADWRSTQVRVEESLEAINLASARRVSSMQTLRRQTPGCSCTSGPNAATGAPRGAPVAV